jgi:hypothetical protein
MGKGMLLERLTEQIRTQKGRQKILKARLVQF